MKEANGLQTDCQSFVVQDAVGRVMAVFLDDELARAYVGGRRDHRVLAIPLILDGSSLRTVFTRWIEIDADGTTRVDDRDSYQCCSLDGPQASELPSAEIEYVDEGSIKRLLCVGTDNDLIDARVKASLAMQGVASAVVIACRER